jgi:ABC-type polar amino acid transport system ATPase subunit
MDDVTPSGDFIVTMQAVDKFFGDFQALHHVDLQVRRQERIVLCGPSGSGKSTLIRCINQLEHHQAGRITFDGMEVGPRTKGLDRVRREIGMVFQSFNLFPHLTVLQNCMLAPMKVRGTAKPEAEALARDFLARVRIPEQADKYPGQLSGGQQQRVAIARAVHASQGDAVRRTDLGAGSGDGEGGAGDDDRPGRGRHDHAVRDA